MATCTVARISLIQSIQSYYLTFSAALGIVRINSALHSLARKFVKFVGKKTGKFVRFQQTFSRHGRVFKQAWTLLIWLNENVPLYITAKVIWNFLFFNTDFYENRAHVHVGKRNTEKLCKIWLEPNVELAAQGDLSNAQVKEVLRIANEYRDKLLKQWELC